MIIQSAAWDADGRCFAFTPRGPLFWNGQSWLEAPEVSRALPEGMSFARRYEAGGWNALHQDLYGELVFPLQVTVMLDRPDVDFTGGDFLLVEQRPRMQSRGHAIALGRGDAVVFPCRTRPAQGARGSYQVGVRHGVSTVLSGRRTTLGLIFHDAK